MSHEEDLPKKLTPLTAGYQDASTLVFDELFEKGQVRPHWRDFMRAQERLGMDEINAREQELDRLLHENGVTYNAYSDGNSLNRPWDLDPCPLILDGNEWCRIEPALKQRSELLNAIYKDIYGPQKLLKAKVLPAELIFQHPGFCRAAVGIANQNNYQLLQAAFNLVRGSDNQWWVLSDRLQAAQGSGYVLETRLAMSRVYPNLMRHCQVQRLSNYYSLAHKSLRDATDKDHPHIVLLSPGPLNESYFEDAYLANYQGYTLVQGDDLVVRQGYVWLKTLHGLQKVDVILRRISDQFSDPLELRPDSFIGVSGLLEVMRQQNVIVANPIGAWLLESPAFYPYLEQCCEFLFDEKLKMPSAATWWCGEPKACAHVIKQLDTMVIKHISDRHDITFCNSLSAEQKTALVGRIQANPCLYVGQQMLHISTMPSWTDNSLTPRHGVLRTFVCATNEGYQLMPGGLTSIARTASQNKVNAQTGSVNKDTWVQATELLPLRPFVSNVRNSLSQVAQRIISSRTAENLFWLGRYSQRAEIVARMMRKILNSYVEDMNDEGDASVTTQQFMDALIAFTGFTATNEEAEKTPDLDTDGADVDFKKDRRLIDKLYDIALSESVPRGLYKILQQLYTSAFHSRDVWSNDSWRVVNDIGEVLPALRKDQRLVPMIHALDDLLSSLMALNGLIADSMNHDDGWRMLDIGRLLERSLNLSHLIQYTIAYKTSDNESEILSSLLSSNDNIMNYRRYYRGEMDVTSVLDYILLNRFNPRGMAYQLDRLQMQVKNLFEDKAGQMSSTEKSILSAYTHLQLADMPQLATKVDELNSRKYLIQLMQTIYTNLETTSTALSQRCFVHTQKENKSSISHLINTGRVE